MRLLPGVGPVPRPGCLSCSSCFPRRVPLSLSSLRRLRRSRGASPARGRAGFSSAACFRVDVTLLLGMPPLVSTSFSRPGAGAWTGGQPVFVCPAGCPARVAAGRSVAPPAGGAEASMGAVCCPAGGSSIAPFVVIPATLAQRSVDGSAMRGQRSALERPAPEPVPPWGSVDRRPSSGSGSHGGGRRVRHGVRARLRRLRRSGSGSHGGGRRVRHGVRARLRRLRRSNRPRLSATSPGLPAAAAGGGSTAGDEWSSTGRREAAERPRGKAPS